MYKKTITLSLLLLGGIVIAQDIDLEDIDLEDIELGIEDLGEINKLETPGNVSINNGELKAGNDVKIDANGLSIKGAAAIDATGLTVENSVLNTSTKLGKTYQGDDFFDVDWSGRDLSGVTFTSVNFYSANLSGVDFSNAVFSNTDFENTILDGACFYGARISNTDVDQSSSLINTNFTNSTRSNSEIGADQTKIIWNGEKCGNNKPTTSRAITRSDFINADAIIQGLLDQEKSAVDLTINFATDSAQIIGKARAQVYEVAKALKSSEMTNNKFRIEGHTDSDGEADYNIDLSYRRALAVSKSLSDEYEINPQRLSVNGYGESQPLSNNNSPQAKSINRRVTIVNLGQ